MELSSGAAWQEAFETFWAPFGHFFKRSESRSSAKQYVRGLLADVTRKNCWQLAEAMGEAHPDGMEYLLYGADREENALCRQLRVVVKDEMGYEPGIGGVDESGFVKKGECSAGVKRQYCGRVGKIENCQVGVYLGYIAPGGHALIDRELYLPKDWCEDPVRRPKAKIPETVAFATKPHLALRMLERTWAEGLPMDWVVGDSTYGHAPTFREAIAATGRFYVLEIPKSASVQVGGTSARSVESVVATVPDRVWSRYALNLNEQGLRWSDWTALRVIAPTDTLGEQWLVIRRTVDQPPDTTYFLSNAPADTPLETLAQVGGARYHVEHLLEEAKGTAGLGQYEVRYWHSWYRHMTLALIAHTWLTVLRHADAQKKPRPAAFLAAVQSG